MSRIRWWGFQRCFLLDLVSMSCYQAEAKITNSHHELILILSLHVFSPFIVFQYIEQQGWTTQGVSFLASPRRTLRFSSTWKVTQKKHLPVLLWPQMMFHAVSARSLSCKTRSNQAKQNKKTQLKRLNILCQRAPKKPWALEELIWHYWHIRCKKAGMALRGLSVRRVLKATCSRLDSKGIFNKQLNCLTMKTKNAIQTYHCLFTLCSLNFSVAFGHCEKKKKEKKERIKQALNLRPLSASVLVKIHSSPSEISDTNINKINIGCFQIDLMLFWVGRGFHLHNNFFFSLGATNATTNKVVIGIKTHWTFR